MRGELPIRIVDDGSGPVLRCLCGAESATLRKGTVNRSMTRLRSSGPAALAMAAGLTPADLLIMVAHARTCARAAELGGRDV